MAKRKLPVARKLFAGANGDDEQSPPFLPVRGPNERDASRAGPESQSAPEKAPASTAPATNESPSSLPIPAIGFTIKYVKPTKVATHGSKKRKVSPTLGDPGQLQRSPFKQSPSGDVYYRIEPSNLWKQAQRYKSFSISGQSFPRDSIVYVNPSQDEDADANAPVQGWVAKVLEICAVDQENVFLRVFWFYRPEDLPCGRQSYHGTNELIASNDMAIIDARTVDGMADMTYWDDENDEQGAGMKWEDLFWRQTLDVSGRKPILSKLTLHCIEKAPFCPDTPLIQCDSCGKWLHGSCLEKEAVRAVYEDNGIPYPGSNRISLTMEPLRRGPKGRRGKKETRPASVAEPELSFAAALKSGDDILIDITDLRDDGNYKYEVPVTCLLCKATIGSGAREESIAVEAALPTVEVDAATSTQSTKGSSKKGKRLSATAEQADTTSDTTKTPKENQKSALKAGAESLARLFSGRNGSV